MTFIGKALARSMRAALLVLAFAPLAAQASPRIGEPAPEFVAADSTGKTHRLSDYRGRTVVLEWTNDGCPFVQKHYGAGNMQALQAEATLKNVVWLSVVSSAPGTQGYVEGLEADELTKSRNATPAAVLLDPAGKIGRLYDARTTPHMYVISPDGKLAYKGAIDDKPTLRADDIKVAVNYVRSALAQLQAGQPVNPSVTRPYGCSIKYAD